MNKPQDYDSYQPGGGRLPVGGYICTIMDVKETKSRAGKAMLEIALDIGEGEYKDFYAKRYKANTNINKKWGCRAFVLAEGEHINMFMNFCKCYELSNNTKVNWVDSFAGQFKGKKIGALFGEEEFMGENGVATAVKLRTFQPSEVIEKGAYEIPKKRPLKEGDKGFYPVNNDETLPF